MSSSSTKTDVNETVTTDTHLTVNTDKKNNDNAFIQLPPLHVRATCELIGKLLACMYYLGLDALQKEQIS